MTRLVLLAAILTSPAGAWAEGDGSTIQIHEFPPEYLPDLHDRSLRDWTRILPGPSLDQTDFSPLGQPGTAVDPADLSFRIYLAWNCMRQRLYVAVEVTDDVYVNTYGGGNLAELPAQDGIMLMVDADHRGGKYDGFTDREIIDRFGLDDDADLSGYRRHLTFGTAQRYVVIADAPDGLVLDCPGQPAWLRLPPAADAGGYVDARSSSIELYVQPQMYPEPNGPSGTAWLWPDGVIGFQIVLQDVDEPGEPPRQYSIAGAATVMTSADDFVDGRLFACCGGWCGTHCEGDVCGGHGGDCWGTSVVPNPWGAIKRAFGLPGQPFARTQEHLSHSTPSP